MTVEAMNKKNAEVVAPKKERKARTKLPPQAKFNANLSLAAKALRTAAKGLIDTNNVERMTEIQDVIKKIESFKQS